MSQRKAKIFIAFSFIIILMLGCVRAQREKEASKSSESSSQVYKEINPETFPFPDRLKETLPGLQGDKIYVYKEISPTINLVAYFPEYSTEKAILRSAEAFLVLLEQEELKRGIEFWIIQVQPEKGDEVMVWGVKPSEVEAYARSKDITSFLRDSEYLLVNDKIIPKGEERLKYLSESGLGTNSGEGDGR